MYGLSDDIISYREEIETLKKENKQLKERIEELRLLVKSLQNIKENNNAKN